LHFPERKISHDFSELLAWLISILASEAYVDTELKLVAINPTRTRVIKRLMGNIEIHLRGV
jgi:hypothetical protein